MFPSEMVILMSIAAGKDGGKKLQIRQMDVVGEYIGYLYDSLIRRGYIKGDSSRGYQLTFKGKESLAGFLHENKTRVKDTTRRLQLLGIEINEDIESLELYIGGIADG